MCSSAYNFPRVPETMTALEPAIAALGGVQLPEGVMPILLVLAPMAPHHPPAQPHPVPPEAGQIEMGGINPLQQEDGQEGVYSNGGVEEEEEDEEEEEQEEESIAPEANAFGEDHQGHHD